MKKFFSVFEFEILGYLKSKVYWGVVIALISITCILMFIPRLIDLKNSQPVENEGVLVICDYSSQIKVADLKAVFNYEDIEELSSKDEIIEYVEAGKADAGFVINSISSFSYYVYNSSFFDDNAYCMEQYMKEINTLKYCEKKGIDYTDFVTNTDVKINSETNVLGKDSINSYVYCYALVSILFIIMIFYGNMIATSITTEKSGRIIEILVTSTNTKALLCGKVLAGTLAVVIQVSLILSTAWLGYKLNYDFFDDTIKRMFDIPILLVVIFAVFGIVGIIFYNFLFGGLGAMLAKTEDVQNASLPLQLLLMIIYMFAIFELRNVDGILFKVSSYLPISSCYTMFVRWAMGTVSVYECVLSFIILVISVILVGYIVSGKYKKNILNYGNKLSFINRKRV